MTHTEKKIELRRFFKWLTDQGFGFAGAPIHGETEEDILNRYMKSTRPYKKKL